MVDETPSPKKKSTRARKKPAAAAPTPIESPTPDAVAAEAKAAQSDIRMGAWIIHALPESMRPYALLMRLDRPIGIWLLFLPCIWGLLAGMGGISGFVSHIAILPLLFAFAVGSVFMRGAGCIINDLWDKEIDPEVERTKYRPLASGAITPNQALIFMGFLLAVSAMILFTMNLATIALGIVALACAVLYPLMKRVTFWPQAFLGITFNMGVLMACTALTGVLNASAFLIYLGAISWTIAYDTIYARQDIDDDLRVGMKSTAILFAENIRLCVTGFMVITIGFFVMAGISAHAFGTYYAVLALPALHAYLTLKTWRENDGQSCLAAFRAQRDFGILCVIAFMFL